MGNVTIRYNVFQNYTFGGYDQITTVKYEPATINTETDATNGARYTLHFQTNNSKSNINNNPYKIASNVP